MGREASSKTFLGRLVEKIHALKKEVIGRRALGEPFLTFVDEFEVVKRNVMGSSFGANEVQGYGNSANEDLQTGAFLPGQSSRHATKLNPENIVVGLEDDLMRIMSRLKGPISTREIVPIVGMGGIGKTTLARKAYDLPEIRHHFDIHVWMTISQDYQIRELLFSVVSCVTRLTDKIKEESNDELMDMIHKKFKCKRYLVVMDDIWSNDVWDLMSRTFPDDGNGSRIILTSRLKDVAMHADPDSPPHEMRLLNLEDSWKLLQEKVFEVQQHVCPPELEDIGKQVAQGCHGLPLALAVVAGYLSKIARTPERWKGVAKCIGKVVANESDKFLGVLAMSYNYLPNHLKPCFLYMGVFPEDMEVNIERLINLWVYEGFLLEEAGRDCLDDLVSRNLIMVRNRRFNGKWKTCGVHDLVRDLILREAEKEKLLVTSNRIHSEKKFCRYSFRSYINYDADCWDSSHSISGTTHSFCGLYLKTPSKQVPHLAHFKLLRVLAIPNYYFPKFPLEITKLAHLRLLDFSCRDLHRSVSELYNLRTLIFQPYSFATAIPETIWRMEHLRHLHINGFFSFPTPSNKLQNLEGLSYLYLTSCSTELFSAIPNLKRLKIFGTSKNSQQLNSLSCLKELEMLKFRGNSTYPIQIPSKNALPTSLKSLTLSLTNLPWKEMANIVTLPNLEELKIKQDGFRGGVWRLNDEVIFYQLKFLLMESIGLVHWELAGSGNFPKLERLVLKRCYHLSEIPKDIGEICTLKSLELYDSAPSATRSAKEIQEEQESMGNHCLSFLIDNHRLVSKFYRDKL